MKKIVAILLTVLLVFSFVACGNNENTPTQGSDDPSQSSQTQTVSGVKVGFIFLHDENSTYDLNFINAAKAACERLGVEYLIKTNIPESSKCYETALDLADEGCNIVFADSFGHDSFMLQAATECPDVEFCHATGTLAHTGNVPNYHNAFAAIYQGRYIAGVAAGMEMQNRINKGEFKEDEALVGYVGAYTYAEVMSGYTSFFLGLRSECPSAKMQVIFTGSWYDETLEKEAAQTLLNNGCKLISQHADSMGAPTACEVAGVTNVTYNGSTQQACPNTYLISSRINWEPYFEFIINAVANGEKIPADWTGTLENGAVQNTELNEAIAAPGTKEKLAEVYDKLVKKEIHVFDTSTFTVTVTDKLNVNATVDSDGHLISYKADVDTDPNYAPDTEAVTNGYFDESTFRSAPYFDIQIDGIELLNSAF